MTKHDRRKERRIFENISAADRILSRSKLFVIVEAKEVEFMFKVAWSLRGPNDVRPFVVPYLSYGGRRLDA
jgi:hypothetical protein